ncbi:HNH endonuclease [Stenotrophomonas maltophilia]|uniref:HNH endonuclease n=1 Tax=Stenotrophomonas maltophilia TaxID=40324 RepID=UPI0039C12A4D
MRIRGSTRKILEAAVRKSRRETVYKMLCKRNSGSCPCFVCGRHVKAQHATLEHILPVSKGGTDDMSNLAISHNACNARRGNSSLKCAS